MKEKLAKFLRIVANRLHPEEEVDICSICHEPGADKMR